MGNDEYAAPHIARVRIDRQMANVSGFCRQREHFGLARCRIESHQSGRPNAAAIQILPLLGSIAIAYGPSVGLPKSKR